MNIESFAKQLKKEKSVAIFCHINPDGDTIGSAVALSLALYKEGIYSKVFCSDKISENFYFLDKTKDISDRFNNDFTALFAIDCSDIYRLGDFYDVFSKHKNTYCLDHHVSNNNFAKYNCVILSASNCENTLRLINLLGSSVDAEMANYLLLGIVTDTGNFRHKNVKPETLSDASFLLSKGADLNNIVYKTFVEQSKEKLKLFSVVMSRIRFFYDDRVAIATVFLKDLEQCNANKDETDGFVDSVISIKNVEVGVCIKELEHNRFKISLRSKKTDVNKVAGVYGGGGHVLASGCQINGDYEEVIDKLTYTISQYLSE